MQNMETEPTIPFWQEDPFSERTTQYLETLENYLAFLKKLKDPTYREEYAKQHPGHTESILNALKRHDNLLEAQKQIEAVKKLRESLGQ